MNFVPIKLVLSKVLADKRMALKFTAAETCVVAEKLFLAELPHLSGKFSVKFVKKNVLHISVLGSSLSAELRLAESEVLKLLQKRGSKVTSIRYSVGKLPDTVLPY